MLKFRLLLLVLIWTVLLCSQPSPFIHLDQFGYWPDAEKVAVLSDPQLGFNAAEGYTPANVLELRDAATDAIVFMGSPTSFNAGQTENISGDRGWWFDFSIVGTSGSYYVYDLVNDERSVIFEIRENPYRDVLRTAGRMFFYNRCNFPKAVPYADPNWTDGMNFTNPLQDTHCRYIYDPENAALEKDLSGGWFDAGDYNKYVTFAEGALHNLLNAFEENPDAFGDNWNIPESGNEVPDLLDEVKWELDWLLKMINSDGSTHIKMGSSNFSDNTASPPSTNTDQRFYGPICTSASASAASALAHAALIFNSIDGYDDYVEQLRHQAGSTFGYAASFFENEALETDCDDGSIVAGDADRSVDGQLQSLITASIYLYTLTGNPYYHEFFLTHYDETGPLTNDFWEVNGLFLQDALIHYLSLSSGDVTAQDAIRNSATTAVNNNWNGFFGWQENDLYRSFMPDWSYHWGSNRPKANYGSLNLRMARYGLCADSETLERKAAEQLHYFHGVNPLGMVMLSNMYNLGGDRCVNEIYHTWFHDGTIYDNALTSEKGPAPGYVTGGPNAFFSVTDLSPPSGQPALKSYLDFNDGWPLNSWEISEPAIYYQAAYIRLLARFTNAEDLVNGTAQTPLPAAVVYPNPAQSIFRINLPDGVYALKILDEQGRLMQNQLISSEEAIDISALPKGLYLLEVASPGGQYSFKEKLVKL